MKLIELNWQPTVPHLRQFSLLSLFALPTVGWIWGASPLTIGLLAAAGFGLVVMGWLVPDWLKPFFLGTSLVAVPIGLVLGELALLVVFLLVIFPVSLVLRLTRQDPLRLKLNRNAASYWQAKDRPGGPSSYYRQS